jgi:Methyltransferase domain
LTEALEAHLRRQIEHSRRFFWQRLRWRAVRNYLPTDSAFDLVDVGAGAGLLGDFLSRDRPRATYEFVEPIESLRQFLRERYGDQADVADQSDFEDASFVTLLDVLEHQEDDQAFMAELVGKMPPGSMLLLTVPALQKLWSDWDVALGHFRRYDKNSLLRCVEALPLTINEMSFLFPEMVPLGILRARRKNAKAQGEDAEFPDLPGPVNDLLYGLGTASLALRRKWRTGTSLFLAATVEGG